MYKFQEIWGNASLVAQLRTAVAGGRTSHAYLFLGGEGAGKRLIANAFAKALQCTASRQGDCCDSCKSCLAFDHGNHPDVIYVRGEKKTLGVEEIREQILETVDLKPYQYARKIYIIEKADTMTVQAQNALLKTLEEPPAYALFLLLAQREELFLPTILSRVVTMKLSPLSEGLVAEYLQKHTALSAEESGLYAACAQGRIGQALALTEDESFRKMREDILDMLKALPSMTEADAYLLAKDLEGYKNDLRFLDIMELWYRDLLAAKSLRQEKYLIQKDRKDDIFHGATEPAAVLAKKANAVAEARKRLALNGNFRLTMEVMLMECKEKNQ